MRDRRLVRLGVRRRSRRRRGASAGRSQPAGARRAAGAGRLLYIVTNETAGAVGELVARRSDSGISDERWRVDTVACLSLSRCRQSCCANPRHSTTLHCLRSPSSSPSSRCSLYFLVLELFLWTKPAGRRAFRTTQEQEEQSRCSRRTRASTWLPCGGAGVGADVGAVGRGVVCFFLVCGSWPRVRRGDGVEEDPVRPGATRGGGVGGVAVAVW